MAKQKYEITAFTKGIIGSPSETDIPEDAASYSVNIDPNAEDGVLRGIKKDTVLNNDGFAEFTTSTADSSFSSITIQILRSAAAVDNGSSTYNYNGAFFMIVSPQKDTDGNNIVDYIWFDQDGTDPDNTDPLAELQEENPGVFETLRNGIEVEIEDDSTVEQIRDLIYTEIPVDYWTRSKLDTDKIVITSSIAGYGNPVNTIPHQGQFPTGKISVADGDDNVNMPNELDYYTLINASGTSKTFTFVDANAAGCVAHETVLAEGSDYGSDVLPAGHARIGSIAVAANITGTKAYQYDWLVQLKTAIEGENGLSGILCEVPSARANGSQDLDLTIITYGPHNTTITESVTHPAYTKTDFSGGKQGLFGRSGEPNVIDLLNSETGHGLDFPMDDFVLINRGSADNNKTIYDAIGVDFANNQIFKVEDLYANQENFTVSLNKINPTINHNNTASFVVKNKTTHIGFGNTKNASTKWVGWIDNTQFNNTLSGYFLEPDALINVGESASPVNLDHIVSFPLTYDTDDANMVAFSGVQGWHADVANMSGNDLDYQMFNASGLLYSMGDNDTQDINQYGKLNDSTPKIGWCFRISSAHDTSDAKLLAAKKAFYDAHASTVIAAGDIFQIADIGTTGDDNTKLNYIGNAVDATPAGNSGDIAFSYGIVEGSKYLYRVSMTSQTNANAFTTAGVSRYMKYDLSHIIGDSGVATIATCMTPVTTGTSKSNSQYLTYGDGSMDAMSVAKQDIRGLHQFLWISNNDGDMFRINISDLDEQNADETYSGVKLDYKVNFNYSNIAKCGTTSDDDTFKKWFGAIHNADDAEKYYFTEGDRSSGRAIQNKGGSSITWDDDVAWSREPSAVKVVGICETQTNRGYKASDSITIEDNTWSDYYVFQLTNSTSGPRSIDGRAQTYGTSSNYELDQTMEIRMEQHNLDVGDVITVYMLPTSSITDASEDGILGNTIVSRIHDENHVAVGGDVDDASSVAYDSVGFYQSKVWVLFAKQDPEVPFERWDLFLYNFNPATISSNERAMMYDRTPPYSELGISKWNGVADDYSEEDLYNAQNGTFELGIDKESILFYDANGAEDHTETNLSGSWKPQNHTWPSISEDRIRMQAYKRRDGTVVCYHNGLNECSQQHMSWGHNSGWYGDDNNPDYRKVIPISHTLQPEAIRDFKYTQTVGFMGKVSGKFSTRPGLSWRHQIHDSGDALLHYGNAWEIYNNDDCFFKINDHAGHTSGYSLLFGSTYRDGKGHSYADSNTSVYQLHEGTGSTMLYTLNDGSWTTEDGLTDRISHYFAGGRYKSNTNLGGRTDFSTYDGTKMAPTVIPYSNSTAGTLYQGQIGDYLFIDRKWLSIDHDPEAGGGGYYESLRATFPIWESENDNTWLQTRFGNNVRLATSPAYTTSSGIHNSLYSDTANGYIDTARKGVSGDSHGGYNYNPYNSRPTMVRQATWISVTHRSDSNSEENGPYKWDARIYAPAWGTMHYLSCTMRKLEYGGPVFNKIRQGKMSHINELTDADYTPNGKTIYGVQDHLYLISGRINVGQEKSVLAAYRPYNYADYPITSQDAVDVFYSGYAHFGCTALVPLQSYKEYADVPKIVFNNSKFAGQAFDGTANQKGWLVTGNRTPTTADATNKQFTIRGDNDAQNGKFIWDWDANAVADDGYMVDGTFSDIYAGGSIHADNLLAEGDSLLTITNDQAGDTGEFPANSNIRYKISLIYDGYQESPLSSFFWDKDIGGTAQKSVTVKVSVEDPGVFSARITHMVIYRRVGDNTLYRMVKQIPFNEGWVYVNSLYTYTFIDNHRTGSYEAMTGISEDTEETNLNYSLSCEINDELFAADCYTDVLEKGDARRYIFKSKPGNYSQFDLKKDYLILRTIPTAMVSFNGRVYAFDRSNTYKINPDGMFIEDTYEGVGCLSQDSIAISEFGMCFADSNNVYLHDGNTPVQIANNILNISTLEGFTIGYQQSIVNTENNNEKPKVYYDGKANSFVVFIVGTCTTSCSTTVNRAFAYNLSRNRWDYWESPRCKQARTGQDNDILITDGSLLFNYKNSLNYRSWEFRTKQLSLSQLGNNKRFHRINTFGAPTMTTITSPSNPLNNNILVFVDGVPQDLTLENIRYNKEYTGAKLSAEINNSATSISLAGHTADAPLTGQGNALLPRIGSYLMINDEIVKITAETITHSAHTPPLTTGTYTITRSELGTTAVTQAANSRLYYIAPSIKLPSKCKGKKIEIHLKGQSGIVDGIGVDFINKGNG